MSDIHAITYVAFCAIGYSVHLFVLIAFAINEYSGSLPVVTVSIVIGVIIGAAACIPIEQTQRNLDYEHATSLLSAREEGYNAATQNIPPTACPYEKERKTHWMNGWQEGFKETKHKENAK